MPANYTKKIICLANSRKPGGRCIAGREILKNGYGGWIRPVSARPSAEVSLDERRYENGADPEILDILRISLIGPVPKIHQTENHMLDPAYYWIKDGSLKWSDLPPLVETPKTLWTNEISTYHGVNDAVPGATAADLNNSLYLIKPPSVNILVQVEGGLFGPTKKRVRADFKYNGIAYRFMVTDPQPESVFLARGESVLEIKDPYLCVSLTEPFSGDGRCHKLVATIITKKPLE